MATLRNAIPVSRSKANQVLDLVLTISENFKKSQGQPDLGQNSEFAECGPHWRVGNDFWENSSPRHNIRTARVRIFPHFWHPRMAYLSHKERYPEMPAQYQLAYQKLITEIREAVANQLPEGSYRIIAYHPRKWYNRIHVSVIVYYTSHSK